MGCTDVSSNTRGPAVEFGQLRSLIPHVEVSHHEGLGVRRRIWRNQETPVKSLPVFLGKASSCLSAVTKGFIISGSLLKTSSRADLAISVAQMLLTRCPVVSIGSKRRTGQVHNAWRGFSKRPLGPCFSTPHPTHYPLPSSPFGVAVGLGGALER